MFKDGRQYTGNFANGSYNGQGVLLLADGRRYEGTWFNNLPNGFGTQANPDGTIYAGAWKDGKYDGQGPLMAVPTQAPGKRTCRMELAR